MAYVLFVWIHRQTVDIQLVLHCINVVAQRAHIFSTSNLNIALNVTGELSMVDTLRGDYLGEKRNVQRKQHCTEGTALVQERNPKNSVFAVKDGRLLLIESNQLLEMCRARTDSV